MIRNIIVVGGGVSGLVAARSLAATGDHVTVLECDDRVGGALRSAELGGVSIDVGAEAYAVTRPETRTLIEELGLSERIVSPRRSNAHLLLDSGLHAMPHAMMGVPTDLLSPEVVEILGADEAKRARDLDAMPVDRTASDISLGALVRSRMGDKVADCITTPVVAGVHAANPDLIEATAVIPGLLPALAATGGLAAAAAQLRSTSGAAGSAIAGLRGGMTTLVDALEHDVEVRGVQILQGVCVRSVQQTKDGWRVITGAETFTADAVVLAVDAPSAARLLHGVSDVTEALADITVGDVAVCAALFDSPQLDGDPVGSGLLVAPGHPRVRAKALTHATAKWQWIREAYGPGRHLVRLSYGRDGRIEEVLADLPEIARADIAEIFSIPPPEFIDVRVVRWPSSLVFPRPGHRARVEQVRATVAHHHGLVVVGAGIGGNGLGGTIALSQDAGAQL
jgi:oxygen-dependent protoporphyrinogen oxidase